MGVKNVAFVIPLKQLTICLLIALLQKLFGAWSILLIIFLHQLMLLICLVNGLMGYVRRINIKSVWKYLLYVGPFGGLGMILFLTNRMELTFCRLSDALLIGFSNGFSFSHWNIGRIWLLDATGC
jgi:hypothetical protein